MKHILATGISGLVGSRLATLLAGDYEFEDISRKTGTDITDKDAVLKRLKESDSPFIVHFAAYTNVDQAEMEKDNKQGDVWKINVEGTQNVVDAAVATGKHLIHISTDMVFPGTKKLPERYKEEDATGPVGWYARTKAEAEKIVLQSNIPFTLIRIAYPYSSNLERKSYVLIFKTLLEQGKQIDAVADHFFTPLFIDDLAPVFHLIFQEKLKGIYHVGGKDIVSPIAVAQKVAEVFHLDKNLIHETTREEFFKDKAPRAYNLSLDSAKIESLGIQLKGLEEGLLEVKKQLI